VNAIVANHLNYEGVAGNYKPTDQPIGLNLSPELQAWILSNVGFSEEFFSNMKPVDHIPNALGISWRSSITADPEKFARYSSLALAIALVYDVPPPPYWPHIQVSAEALPRKLPKPAAAFERLTRRRTRGAHLFWLTQLRAEELKFVVDARRRPRSSPGPRRTCPIGLDDFEQAYFDDQLPDRPGERLCRPQDELVGQALHAPGDPRVRAGSASTRPTSRRRPERRGGSRRSSSRGSGQDGRHAWFGFLDGEHKWRLDAGRYAEQRLVTGNALDPQTWMEMSDHELEFLSERFRALPTFMQSRVHEEFAADFLPGGRRAFRREGGRAQRRQLRAAQPRRLGDPDRGERRAGPARPQQEGSPGGGLAFTPKYPDLVVSYVNRVCESLRARGETSLAPTTRSAAWRTG
jgi:hypothetical protein